MERRAVVAFGALVVVFGAASAAPARADARGAWVRPVGGAVVRAFDPPRTQFGRGHVGSDLRAPAGTRVRAAGAGTVAFAGPVAGSLHVVIAHAGNLRTSYSFLASVAIRRGESVEAGQVIGTAGGVGPEHDGTVLHLGLRIGASYVDPMSLFRPVDLSAIVHLAPTSDPPRAESTGSERHGLIAGLAHVAGLALAAGKDAVVAGVRRGQRALEAAFPLPAAAVRGAGVWVAQHGHCDSHAPAADGEGGSEHRVMIVAGIGSSFAGGQSSLVLSAPALGYRAGEASYFSYAKDGGDYTSADTEGPLLAAARRLADQLRELQRREPGREVDLLAHSQGGVVVEAFLMLVYERGDRSYPPLGSVVTLSAPLRGDPLASAVAEIGGAPAGRALLGAVDAVAPGHAPGLRSDAVRDLAAGSEFMHKLDAARMPDEVEVTTIGSATDVIVPGTAAALPGARHATVVPRALNAHTAIVSDRAALQIVRAALENRALPCESLATALAGEIVPTVITALERDGGRVGGLVAGGR